MSVARRSGLDSSRGGLGGDGPLWPPPSRAAAADTRPGWRSALQHGCARHLVGARVEGERENEAMMSSKKKKTSPKNDFHSGTSKKKKIFLSPSFSSPVPALT